MTRFNGNVDRTPFLDDRGPPRPTGFFEGMDEPAGAAPATADTTKR